jgi:hypothetical protein
LGSGEAAVGRKMAFIKFRTDFAGVSAVLVSGSSWIYRIPGA